jgi:hypothetical protein
LGSSQSGCLELGGTGLRRIRLSGARAGMARWFPSRWGRVGGDESTCQVRWARRSECVGQVEAGREVGRRACSGTGACDLQLTYVCRPQGLRKPPWRAPGCASKSRCGRGRQVALFATDGAETAGPPSGVRCGSGEGEGLGHAGGAVPVAPGAPVARQGLTRVRGPMFHVKRGRAGWPARWIRSRWSAELLVGQARVGAVAGRGCRGQFGVAERPVDEVAARRCRTRFT